MDRTNFYKKLAEMSIDQPTDRNDILAKRFGAPMKKMTYRDTCIDYVKKTMRCVGYRDYIIEQLNKMEEIEEIVNRELIAGKHNYQTCYQAFFEIADVIQK